MKRPVSHICAMFVYILFILLNVQMLMHGVHDPVSEALGLLCVVLLLGAMVAPRERRQYLMGVIVLTLIWMDALYDTVLLPAEMLHSHAAGVRVNWTMVAINAVAVAALARLPYTYAFGSASRVFFGLPPLKKK